MIKIYVDNLLNTVFWIGLLAFTAAVVTWLWKLRKKHLALSKIPGLTLHPVVEIMAKLIYIFQKKKFLPLSTCVIEHACGLAHLFDNQALFKQWMPFVPIVTVYEARAVEVFLNSKGSQAKSWEYEFLKPWLGLGLLTSAENKWKKRRKILTPSFHFGILEGYLPIMNNQSMVLVKKLKSLTDKEWIDISPLISLCTLDIISESIMGVRIEAQANTDSNYVEAIHELGECINYRIWLPWLWPDHLFYMSTIGKRFKKNLYTTLSFTSDIIKQRKTLWKPEYEASIQDGENDININIRRKKAFLDLLLDLHMNEKLLTETDIKDEVNTFGFEGQDTVAAGISWALYCIGLYPEIENKIFIEQCSIFGNDKDKPVTNDDLKNMKYLEYTLKESQRLFPSVPIIARTLEEDVTINGVTIPKGVFIHLLIYMLHRNKDEFPNPEVFDPERFLPENSIHRHPYAYIPFSGGPRNCIGQKFAMLEMKSVISSILRHFQVVSLDPRDKVIVKQEFVLRPTKPLRVKLIPRL